MKRFAWVALLAPALCLAGCGTPLRDGLAVGIEGAFLGAAGAYSLPTLNFCGLPSGVGA